MKFPTDHSKCAGSVYNDDGHSFEYKSGQYVRVEFQCRVNADGVSVAIGAPQGKFAPWWKQIEVVVYGWDSPGAIARLRGEKEPLKSTVDSSTHTVHVVIPESSQPSEVTLTAK